MSLTDVLQYVDTGYSGGGIGEYGIFDTYKNEYDYSACGTTGGNRCIDMDCHDLDSENWQLLGVYKEASYFGNDDYVESLFKYEGICIWNDYDTYQFMSEAREGSWYSGCIPTDTPNDSGDGYLYIDIKPSYNGNMTYALYDDSVCRYEYDGTKSYVDTVAASMGLLYGKYWLQWNGVLEPYKVCQPCRAYNLKNTNKNAKYSYSDSSQYYDDDANGGYYQCQDAADYTNVNQCMKFRTHAELEWANFEDLVYATNQGGILKINVGGTIFGSDRISREQEEYVEQVRKSEQRQERQKQAKQERAEQEALKSAQAGKSQSSLFLGTSLVTVTASFMYVAHKAKHAKMNSDLQEPLFNSEGTMA